MEKFKTEQEIFWNGEFGDAYIERNKGKLFLSGNLNLFLKITDKTIGINTILEVGANIGMNLEALNLLKPLAKLTGIEINKKAFEILSQKEYVNPILGSIVEYESDEKFDFVFTKGVLIHIEPSELDGIYEKMYNFSNKYICVAEYYNPIPVSIDYRGEKDKLFKRDFAGDLLKKYSDLKLIDYGFIYSGDNNYPKDDLTWFLLEK